MTDQSKVKMSNQIVSGAPDILKELESLYAGEMSPEDWSTI